MTFLTLWWEFFKTGLFSIGGGMATLPFLKAIGEKTGWFTMTDMMNMLAVSESTPGPIGINMATYVGYTVGGVLGAFISTIGEVMPAIIVISLVSLVLDHFRTNKYVDRAFYGLRPASSGLVAAACIGVALEVFFRADLRAVAGSLLKAFSWGGYLSVKALILAAALFFFSFVWKKTNGLHPIIFIGISAVVGVVFRFAGA